MQKYKKYNHTITRSLYGTDRQRDEQNLLRWLYERQQKHPNKG